MKIRVTILEDDPSDAEIIIRELRRSGYVPDWTRVETEPDFLAAIQSGPDLILSDYSLPKFDGLSALDLLRNQSLDIPFILVSGTIGEETAVTSLHRGADDFVLKDGLSRLGSSVAAAFEKRRLRDENKRIHAQLTLQSTALEAAANSILITDAAGTILWTNSACATLSGYTSAELVGQNPRLFKSGLHEVEHYKNLWNTILAGETWRGEIANRRKDQSIYYGDTTITPVRTAGSAITHFIQIISDITERKKSETELQKHAEQLELHNKELQRFNRLSVGRELRMVELKREINELLALAGQPPRYPSEPAEREMSGPVPCPSDATSGPVQAQNPLQQS